MVQRIPSPNELEPIERASRDELQALQLERLQLVAAGAFDRFELARCGNTLDHLGLLFR